MISKIIRWRFSKGASKPKGEKDLSLSSNREYIALFDVNSIMEKASFLLKVLLRIE